MALQMFKIQSIIVGTPVSSIDFTSIPSGYTDLKLVISSRASATNDILIRFNSDTTGNYPNTVLWGGGGTGSVGTFRSATYTGIYSLSISNAGAFTVNTHASCELYIANYTAAVNKTVNGISVQENNSASAGQTYSYITTGVWNNTSAITSLTISPPSSTFLTNSTATLYGIL